MKTCARCGKEKSTDDFYRNGTRLHSYCKKCCIERQGTRQTANPEKVRAYNKANWRKYTPGYKKDPERAAQYRKTYWKKLYADPVRKRKRQLQIKSVRSRRRAILAGLDEHFTPKEFKDQCEAQKGRCFYCLKKVRQLTPDHMTPLSKGGGNGMSNIVGACLPCNVRKGTRTVEEFLSLVGNGR